MGIITLFGAMATNLKYNIVCSDKKDGIQTIGFAYGQSKAQQHLIFQNWFDPESEGENNDIYRA